LEQLNQCPSFTSNEEFDATLFVEIAQEFLNETKIRHILNAMDEVHVFPTLKQLYAKVENTSDNDDEMTERLANEIFGVAIYGPTIYESESPLEGHTLGYWSWTAIGSCYHWWLRPIIPISILETLPPLLASEQYSRGAALLQFQDSLNEYHKLTCHSGKNLAKAILGSLLLYSRCGGEFQPASLCNYRHSGVGMGCQLETGSSVQFWNNIDKFPLTKGKKGLSSTVKELENMFERLLQENSKGAWFIPSNEPTYVIGIFQSINTWNNAVLIIQTKDEHSQGELQEKGRLDLEKDWKDFKALVAERIKCKIRRYKDGGEKMSKTKRKRLKKKHAFPSSSEVPGLTLSLYHGNQEEDVECLFMVLQTYQLPVEAEYAPNQGAGTIQRLHKLLPTAGYAVENAANLHALFGLYE
jgi:hypothetical protein